MNVLQRIAKAITTKDYEPNSDWVSSSDIRRRRTSSNGDKFDNIYDNAIALAKGFARIEPFLVDSKGARINGQSKILDAIYAPLSDMSDYQFRKTLALMTITHDDYYVLIHTKGNSFMDRPTEENITGYEIIQPWNIAWTGSAFSVNADSGPIAVSAKRLMRMTDTLDPMDLTKGYSPMRAVRKWAELDDFIVDYQSGLFAGGAIPQGIFDVVASAKDYEDIRRRILSTIRNSSDNSGVLFNHIPLNSAGQTQAATITWRPMSSTNKEMQTDTLLTNNNRKKDTYFGVPEEIRGYLQNSNYASVRIAEFVMTEYSVRDLALAIWSKFTSELNRCTGGFNAAITFELATPLVADEEKLKAETETLNIDNIFKLVEKGYTVKAAVAALGLPERYANLGEPAAQIEDDPTVQASGEADENPESETNSNLNKSLSTKETRSNFTQSSIDLIQYQTQIKKAALLLQASQANAAIAGIKTSKANGEDFIIPAGEYYYDDKESDGLFEALTLAVLVSLMVSGRKDTLDLNKYLSSIGLDDTLGVFTAGDKKLSRYVNEYAATPTAQSAKLVINAVNSSTAPLIKKCKTQLLALSKSYNKETSALILKTINNALGNKLSASQLTEQLKALGLEDYRAKRLADTEIHRSRNDATLHNLQRLQTLTAGEWEKSAYSKTGSPCPICEAQIGKWVPVNSLFVAKGETMIGTDGKEVLNDYEDIDQAAFHPNCSCAIQARPLL